MSTQSSGVLVSSADASERVVSSVRQRAQKSPLLAALTRHFDNYDGLVEPKLTGKGEENPSKEDL